MSDSITRAVSPERPPIQAPTFQSRTSWSLEIGRLRLALARDREVANGLAAPAPARTAWPFTAGALAGVGTVALLVAGASAAPRDVLSARYLVSVPVPTAVEHRLARAVPRRAATGRATPRAVTTSAGDAFESGDEAHVARALATGAFQEWDDARGQHRFLTAGPARADGGRFCRDMALLVRLTEGGSRVRSTTRCTTGPVSEPAPAPIPADQPAD